MKNFKERSTMAKNWQHWWKEELARIELKNPKVEYDDNEQGDS